MIKLNVSEKTAFLIKNLSKGILWLFIIIAGFIIIRNNVDIDYQTWLKPFYDQPLYVYTIFSLSEVFFGIIPPEIFMLWATEYNSISQYVFIIALLSVLSYSAGIIGFWFGVYLNQTKLYHWFKKKVFGKYEYYVRKFGVYIIIVASLTPIPYSGISMLIGAVKFPFKKFLLNSLMRFVRFALYAFIIWEFGRVSIV